jgi:3-oxoacyl-[acyl-carrier-protein] synthase II
MERIFITGMSVLFFQGSNLADFWMHIGTSDGNHPVDGKIASHIPQVVDSNTARRMDRFARLSLTAATLAMAGSSLREGEYDAYRIGTVFNTGYGPLQSNLTFGYKLLSHGVDMVSPTMFAATVYNAGVGHTCIHLKLGGVSTMLLGSNSLGYSCDLLHSGKAEAILSGGIEELCDELYAAFQGKEYITTEESVLCRPLDKNRNGTRVTEGAAVLVLERENAPFFNAEKALCEILGHGDVSTGIHPAIAVKPVESEAFTNAMRVALDAAKIAPVEIDGIFTAANGNWYSDLAEAQAIRAVFGESAQQIPVTAIKGAVGETMGASLCINTAAAALSLKKGEIPPALGCAQPDPELGLQVVYKERLQGDFRYFIVNGYDVSGSVSSLILGVI